jgi:glycosyltransferase involved in cell wall biosynthesis
MNFNIIGPINQLGYGITALNITKSLHKNNKVSLFIIGQPQVTNQEDADIISECIKNSKFFDYNAPCIRIWHQNDMAQFVGRGSHIGFPIFELDTLDALERHHLSYLDKIFVCSQWAKDVLLNNNIDKEIHVVPLGVDQNIFKPCEPNNNQKTVFFNCGKWEIRKGHDVLPAIFNKAFEVNDNVELWMMNSNPFLSDEETKEWQRKYINTKLGSKIRFIPKKNTQQEVYNTISQIDCGVFPSRAEGWNLEVLEVMACGKHVIATNYSAHTEFCNNANSLLINITSLEKAFDNKWFFNQGNWANMGDDQIEQCVHHMRNIHDQKKNGSLGVNTAGIDTSNKFTWNNSVEKIEKYV